MCRVNVLKLNIKVKYRIFATRPPHHEKYCKKWSPKRIGDMPFQQNDKPDSVPPKICIVPAVPIPNNWVASIINLHNVLPQSVKPPTRFRFGTNHRKPIWGCCTQRLPVSLKPFPICFVTVALIVRLLCLVN